MNVERFAHILTPVLLCTAIALAMAGCGGSESPDTPPPAENTSPASGTDTDTDTDTAPEAAATTPAPLEPEDYLRADATFKEEFTNHAGGPMAALAGLNFEQITMAEVVETVELEWGKTGLTLGGDGVTHDRAQWAEQLRAVTASGYTIDTLLLGSSEIGPSPSGAVFSRIPFTLEGHKGDEEVFEARGQAEVEWTTDAATGTPVPKQVRVVSGLAIVEKSYRRLMSGASPFPEPQSEEDFKQVAILLEERKRLDETTWSKERLAQEHEQTVVKYWDKMLSQEAPKYDVFASVPFDTITFPTEPENKVVDWDIMHSVFGGEEKKLSQEGWRAFLDTMQAQGYKLVNVEFHQSKFDNDPDTGAHSTFSSEFHITNKGGTQRWVMKADVNIDWNAEKDADGHYLIDAIDVTNLRTFGREAPLNTFEINDNINGLASFARKPTPIVYDLDRDGLSEILLPRHNAVIRGAATDSPKIDALFEAPGVGAPNGYRLAAVVADFTGDGNPDIFCTGYYGASSKLHEETGNPAVLLFRGNAEGRFVEPGTVVNDQSFDIQAPIGATAGDVDGDGDLDVWLFQYKAPYLLGQVPTPFYDANDGFPSYLFLNEGDGKFRDATAEAGLEAKRFRRTYSASFIDLDGDLDLDLIAVNDFAGIDMYTNDGAGNFTDVTKSIVDEDANFGMAHSFADFNLDGMLDFYVVGMSSTTMRRLEYMGLEREEFPEQNMMRSRMGYGNRMYMGNTANTFAQPAFRDQVARTGWSWGSTPFDFDNDGDMDLYVANGHISGQTTQDYCSQYWCHDVYTESSQESPVLAGLFKDTLDLSLKTMSWDGYQKNQLLMNLEGEAFQNIAFLVDVALVEDSRGVVSDDLDGDGKVDLIVGLEFRPGVQQESLRVMLNHWPSDNNWIGVRLYEGQGLPSPVGAKITVKYAKGDMFAWVVTGDSFRSQHANTKHFGIGTEERVESITVLWPNGSTWTLDNPDINQYHTVDTTHLAAAATP